MYEATLKSAEANLRSTKSISDRYKQLVDEQAVSRQEYDTALANRLESEANLQTAQINVRNLQNWNSDNVTVVRRQPDGRVARVRFDPPLQVLLTNTFRF